MAKNTKPVGSAFVNESGGASTDSQILAPVEESALLKKNAKLKSVPASGAKKTRRPSRSSRATSKAEKLVCRYCGSDDLAPSFKKRRDARCRACFRKRYGSAAQPKKSMRTRRLKGK